MAASSNEFGNVVEPGIGNEISRESIQAAIAKAVELRALHASLMQGNSPSNSRFQSSVSPVSQHDPQLSAQDYPVFTPSYEDEPIPGYQQILLENRTYSESWGDYPGKVDETLISDYRTGNASSRKGFQSAFTTNSEGHTCPGVDQHSITGSCTHYRSVLRSSPGSDNYSRSRRNSLGDVKSVSSCNKCKPALINSDSESVVRTIKKSNIVVPLTDLHHSSLGSQPKSKGLSFSRLFRLKKKNKYESSTQHEDVYNDLGMLSMESLKKELMEAQESRDSALSEVAEMRSSLGELSQKLEYLENYCEELKKALRQAVQTKHSPPEKLTSFPKRRKSFDGVGENSMPVSDEVMIEGFLQIVSEARLSVKQFCKTLIGQIEETDHTLVDNLNCLLQPYKLALNSKYPKAVLYHLEAIINQSLYQDFENSVFQKNGAPKLLDPQQERHSNFQLFVSLRNLSWNEVLRKGTKYYSDEFSKFCDQKMSGIIATLGWTRPWPEQLLQAFFVAAKCIWLLHLLAFSFDPCLGILRVDENRPFEQQYMEDIFADRQRAQGASRVKIMVMPGFYVHDRVIRCKVLCRYKSVV